MKYNIFLYMLLLCSVMTLRGQQNSSELNGFITDTRGNPIPDAHILLKSTHYGNYSLSNGFYRISNVPPGTYEVEVSMMGYTNMSRKIRLPENGSLKINFVLHSETNTLEEVALNGKKKHSYKTDRVSSSLKLNQTLLKIPQNIQIINHSLLNDQLAFNIFDGVVRNVSGTRRVIHQATYAKVYIRGFSTEQANLRNGMSIANYFGPLKEDFSFVDRIEFVKGPGGFAISNTEPGGFYNVVTKKPTGTNRKNIALTLGSFDTYRVEADLNGRFAKNGKLWYRINLMGKLQNSHIDHQYDNGYAIAPSLTYMISDKTRLNLEYTYQYSSVNNFAPYMYSKKRFKEFPRNTSYSSPVKDPVKAKDHSVFANLQQQFNENWKLTLQLAHLNYKMRGEHLGLKYNTLKENGDALRGITDALDVDNITTTGQVFVNGNITTGSVSHRLLAGMDAGTKKWFADWTSDTKDNEYTNYNIYHPENYSLKSGDLIPVDRSEDFRKRADYFGSYLYQAFYFQDEIGFLNNKLKLSLAGRYTLANTADTSNGSSHTPSDNVFTPRIALSYSITENLSCYSLYDESFTQNYGKPLENGKPLAPSRGKNTELGIKKNWFDGRLSTNITVYNIEKTNIKSEGKDFSTQVGKANSHGVEFDLKGKVLPNLDVVFNYAYTDAKITEDQDQSKKGKPLEGTAKYVNNTWVTYHFPKENRLAGLRFSLGYQWQKERSAWPSGSENLLPDDYFSLDSGLSYKSGKYEFSLLVNNITDNYNYTGHHPGAWGYEHYGWQAEAPRNFRLKFSYTF